MDKFSAETHKTTLLLNLHQGSLRPSLIIVLLFVICKILSSIIGLSHINHKSYEAGAILSFICLEKFI